MGEKPLKYRWVLLFALAVWALLALAIALGTARREGITVKYSFIPLAMLLVALAPVSVGRIVAHKWCVPIATTWGCASIVAIHYVGAWLVGVGRQCDWLVLTATLTVFCLLNGCWLVNKLRPVRSAASRPKTDCLIRQTAAV